jgi:hypothetical protein
MSNLSVFTTYANYLKVQSIPLNFKIANAIRIYAGALCGLPGTNALTSSRGYLVRWQDQINLQWAGIATAADPSTGLLTSARTGTASNVNSVLGDTSLTPIPEISVETGPGILREVTVTGVTAVTDVWRTLVYCSTDNYSDLTTTATSYAPAIGKVVYWNTSTTCSVYLFGMARMTAIS